MRSRARCFNDMHRASKRGGEYLRAETVVVVDLHDILDQLHSVPANIVDAADEGADEIGSSFGGQHGLRGGEAKRHVDANAALTQHRAGANAVTRERHFYDDVVMDTREVAAFRDHFIRLGGHNLGADRAADDLADLPDLV